MRAKISVDSNDFTGHIDVEVSQEVYAYLQRISDRTGQSIKEIASSLIIEESERFNSKV